MTKQASRKRRASQSSRASQSHADELRSLKASLTDLHNKRLNVLRLYQEEKSLRQDETARADHLSSQLKSLQTASLRHPQEHSNPTNIVTTDTFVAELRSLSLAPPVPYASLTWHCLAMADLFTTPPDVLAVLHPKTAVPDPSIAVNDASTVSNANVDTTMKRKSRSFRENGHQISPDVSEDIENLTRRLRQLETEAEATKQSVCDNERLVSDLRSQLDASTAACKDLMQTVQEQRETIERLS